MIQSLCDIAIKAGTAILPYFDSLSADDIDIKKDKSPLTKADKASHNIIEQGLTEQFPNIPILSEEGRDIPFSDRKNWTQFFMVDPLDGTKEFINKNPEYTVNIALIENASVVAGVVYAPSTGELYYAEKGKGAFKRENGKEKQLSSATPESNTLKLVISNSHSNSATQAHIQELESTYAVTCMPTGSSLKLCKVAEKQAHYYPRLGPTMEWDIAAAQIVAEEAGATVINVETASPLIYNKENLLNPFFLCGHPKLIGHILDKTKVQQDNA